MSFASATLKADALACERNGRVVFSGLSFSIAAGELAELRGPNGVGKSTLLRLIAGLLPALAGDVALTPAAEGALPLHCHYSGHLDASKPALSVRENLEFWAAMLGGTDIAEALAAFNLASLADDPVQLLSAGQRRRLALARLLLAKRPVWLLDEPATALDQASLTKLAELMQAHLAEGGIILAATHGDLPLKPARLIRMEPA
ncbi:MAG: heme ABC exporter ATP-binding protein CcmA [Hyphomicrobiales bacterium]